MSDSENTKLFKVYPVGKVFSLTKEDRLNKYEEYELEELIEVLEKCDKGYHTLSTPDTQCIIFLDIDNLSDKFDDGNDGSNPIDHLIDRFNSFMKKYYDVDMGHFILTQNEGKYKSFHLYFPSVNATCIKQQDICQNFHKWLFSIESKKKRNEPITQKECSIFDLRIYGNQLFRLPNQTKPKRPCDKEQILKSKHVISTAYYYKGTIADCIPENIPTNSVNINDKQYKGVIASQEEMKESNKKSNKNAKENKNIAEIEINKKDLDNKYTFIKNIEKKIIYLFIDECFDSERWEDRNNWINIGMSLKNRFGDEGYEIFLYLSKKSKDKYKGEDDVKKTYNSFSYNGNFTIATLYYYAKADNLEKFRYLLFAYSPMKIFEITNDDIAKYIKMLKPNEFIWKDKELYCYNGRYWEKDDIAMRTYISNELYNFLMDMIEVFFPYPNPKMNVTKKVLEDMKKSVDSDRAGKRKELQKLKNLRFKKDVVESTEQYLTNNNIKFDSNIFLFGFNDKVYDLMKGEFREYRYDDHITITTGYEWIEPTQEQTRTITDLILDIHPFENDRETMKQVMATGLCGMPPPHFIIFNNEGRNGKGALNDLFLLGLGKYGMMGNCAILFEKAKTGGNPEKARMDKKRYIVFREPPEHQKLENGTVRELTGGGGAGVRDNFTTKENCEISLNCTIVMECNSKPEYASTPQIADIERLIDIYFPCTYKTRKVDLEEDNPLIKLGNPLYKDPNFQEKHKTALLKILFEEFKKFIKNDFKIIVPDELRIRADKYLSMSSQILVWLKTSYERTHDNENDIVQFTDIYEKFKFSSYYENLSKAMKRKYNKHFFYDELSNCIFLRKNIIKKTNKVPILTGWREIQDDDDDKKDVCDEIDVFEPPKIEKDIEPEVFGVIKQPVKKVPPKKNIRKVQI